LGTATETNHYLPMARCELNQVNQRLIFCNKRRVCTRRVNPRLVVNCETKRWRQNGKNLYLAISSKLSLLAMHTIYIGLSYSSVSHRHRVQCGCATVSTALLNSFKIQYKKKKQSYIMIRYILDRTYLHSSVLCETQSAHAVVGRTLLYIATSVEGGAAGHHTIRVGVTGFDVCRYVTVHSGKWKTIH
jgi:hypothetical protein